MTKFLLLLFFKVPFFLKAQPILSKGEIFYGLALSRPVSLDKQISFQAGIVGELGGRLNIALEKENYLLLGVSLDNAVYHVEGYFMKNGKSDNFILTQNDVKTNTLILMSASFEMGYQKVFEKRLILGADLQIKYTNKARRKYKIGVNKLEETYDFNKKIHPKINGIMGLAIPAKKPLRIDLVIGYHISSLASNTNVNPLTIGMRLARGFGKRSS